MSTIKRWKIKEHYVAGEFAGYVVVTDDKSEDVICHGIGVDDRDDAVLIASAPELEAERDRFREVAEKLVWLYSDEHQGRLDNGLRIDGFYSHEWLGMILDMAREAMKGAEK